MVSKLGKGAKPKAYSYLRFSTPEQLRGDSLRRQSTLAANYAKAHNLDLDTELTFRDLGVSAFRGDNVATGALGAFKAAIAEGIVSPGSYLLVESLDRLSRKTARKALRELEAIVEAGIIVVTLNDGKVFTEETLDGLDLFMALVVMLRAHEESLTKSRRIRAAWTGKRLKARTEVLTAITPGWIRLNAERKPVLIPERAKVVRRIIREVLKGAGKIRIARELNAEKVPTFGRAVMWHTTYLDKILSSPALIGTFVPHVDDRSSGRLVRVPQEPVPDYFPAVTDADTFERLKALQARSPLRGRHASGVVRNVLSNLARCPVCDSTMTRVWKGAKARAVPRLVCVRAKQGAGCKYVTVRLPDIERTLQTKAAHILATLPSADAGIEAGLQDAQAALDAMESTLADLVELATRRPSDALGKRIADYEAEVNEARAERDSWAERAQSAERAVITKKAAALATAMRTKPLDIGRVNAALRELLTKVIVDYRTGYLHLHWLHDGVTRVMFAWPQEDTK